MLGPNGAGKSTLALLLGGLLPPHGGTPASRRSPADARPAAAPVARPRRCARRIGSVFQNPEHQFVTARVADELASGPRRPGREPRRAVVDELLDRLRLARLAAANPYTLSGGEQRRLSVGDRAGHRAPRCWCSTSRRSGRTARTWIELVDLLAELRDDGHGAWSPSRTTRTSSRRSPTGRCCQSAARPPVRPSPAP